MIIAISHFSPITRVDEFSEYWKKVVDYMRWFKGIGIWIAEGVTVHTHTRGCARWQKEIIEKSISSEDWICLNEGEASWQTASLRSHREVVPTRSLPIPNLVEKGGGAKIQPKPLLPATRYRLRDAMPKH